ncbi:MAG: GAF domain-containing protein [Candidatus Goldbacteria bacterium]|nr:GAF domain-containing protein [Candidatus Goldiibacteriota bacterium]
MKQKKHLKNKKRIPPSKEISSSASKYISKIINMEKEISILEKVVDITSKNFDLNKILDKFLSIAMDAVNSDAASLLLIDKISGMLYFAAAKGSKAEQLKKYKLALGEGIAGWVAQTGRPIITPDAQKDKRHKKQIGREINYIAHNILCVPIKFEDEVIGVFEFLNKKSEEPFNDEDLKIINLFTPYIAAIIKNAQLLIENNQKIKRLEHLTELTKHINSTLELNKLLDNMLQISTDMLQAEAGSILLLDEDGDELIFAAATGEKKDKLKDIRVPVGEGIAGWVARENKSVLVADAQNDPRFFKKVDQKTSFKTTSIIAVPLLTKDKLIGVVEVLNKKDNQLFNEEDKQLLEAFANQAAVAIENAKLYENLNNMFLNTVKSLAAAIETKDIYTRGHSERVTKYSELIAKELKLPDEDIHELRLAGLLHDIGKIGIDESILRKPSKLTDTEFKEIKKHPVYAANILEAIPQMKEIIPAIKHHHERYDGEGYPDGLKNDDIPYFARILSIADTFDAMSSNRPYRDALPLEICLQEIKACSGTQFDPEISNAAIKALKKHFTSELENKKEKES